MTQYTAENYQEHPAVQAMLQEGDAPTAYTMRCALVVQSTVLYGVVPPREQMQLLLKHSYIKDETRLCTINAFINMNDRTWVDFYELFETADLAAIGW